MGLFPSYIENTQVEKESDKRKKPKEFEIDFQTGQLTGRIVEGLEAVKVWIWLALQTPRYRYYIYTWDYGHEFDDLIGQGYSEEYITAEVQRMTEDCLLVNQDIKSISNLNINMENDQLTISFTANTIYGSIKFDDEKIARTG